MDLQDVPVTLVIKAPNQRMEDLTVDCMLGWTIRKLKQHLERVYPSQPKQNEQRLIYSGKLLQDHLTLKEILHQFEEDDANSRHTVHLVCSGCKASSSSSSTSQKGSSQSQSSSSSSSTPSSTSPSPVNENTSRNTNAAPDSTNAASQSQGDGLRHRGQPPQQSADFYSTGQYYQVPPGVQMTPEQYTWMMQQQQQMYSQYMMQYMQYYQGMYAAAGQPAFFGGGAMPLSPFGMPGQTMMMPPGGPYHQPATQQQQPAAAAAAAPAPAPAPAAGNNNGGRPNMRMNAQGGMEEDDEEDEGDPRDWLHHTYFLMRVLTFLGILFFYSSVSRFLMVFAGSVAIYFFQKLRKYMQRSQREQEQQRQQQQEQAQAQQEQQQPPQENEAAADQQQQQQQQQPQPPPLGNEQPNADGEAVGQDQPESTQPTEDAQTAAAAAQEEGNRITRAFLFISRTIQIFFTSLVPAPAELLDAN